MTDLPQPTVPDPSEAPPLRWGILGTGQIASAFADALREGSRQTLAAVGSRDGGRAREFAGAHGVSASYGSYQELVDCPGVDIIYVASPHSEHHEHALLAIEAGKHVLVEKAFTRNTSEAREVVDAARSRQVYCAEAMWSRYLPHYDVVRQAVAGGLIGDVRAIVADHGQRLHPNGPQRLSDPGLAGGALLDLGVYPISFAAMLLPGDLKVDSVGALTDQGVDAWATVTLQNGCASATCVTTMLAQTANTAVVAGTGGRLEIDGWFYTPGTVRLVDGDGKVADEWSPEDRAHGLRYEAAEAARCVAAGRTESSYMPVDETLRVMRVMDDVRATLGVRYPGE